MPFRHLLALMALAGLLVWHSQAEYFGFELLAEIAVFAMLAMSLDLSAGYAGMVSLGHAALFGTGGGHLLHHDHARLRPDGV